MRRRSFMAGSAALSFAPRFAQAQAKSTISLVLPMGGGSGGDTSARLVADTASKIMGRNIIVENKPGADTMIGTHYVLQGPSDGTRVLLTTPSTWIILPLVGQDKSFKPDQQLYPVMTWGRGAAVLQCKPGRFKDLQALVEEAKKHPGKISFATYGGHYYKLLAHMIQHELGVVFNHVAYKDATTPTNDLIGGTVDVMVRDAGGSREFFLAGKTQILALTNDTNPNTFNGVKTFTELGYPGIVSYVWTGFAVKAGTPRDVVNELHQVFAQAFKSPEYMAYMERNPSGAEIIDWGPEQTLRHIESERNRFAKLIERTGYK